MLAALLEVWLDAFCADNVCVRALWVEVWLDTLCADDICVSALWVEDWLDVRLDQGGSNQGARTVLRII